MTKKLTPEQRNSREHKERLRRKLQRAPAYKAYLADRRARILAEAAERDAQTAAIPMCRKISIIAGAYDKVFHRIVPKPINVRGWIHEKKWYEKKQSEPA